MVYVTGIKYHEDNMLNIARNCAFFDDDNLSVVLSDGMVVLLSSMDDVKLLSKRCYGVALIDGIFAIACYDESSIKVALDISSAVQVGEVPYNSLRVKVACVENGVAVYSWISYGVCNLVSFIELINGKKLYYNSNLTFKFEGDDFYYPVRGCLYRVKLGNIAKAYFAKQSIMG